MTDKNYYSDVLSSQANLGERNATGAVMLGGSIGGLLASRHMNLSGDKAAVLSAGVAKTIGTAQTIGTLLGHLAARGKDLTAEGKDSLRAYSSLSFAPGVYHYRQALRDAYVDSTISKGKNKHRSSLAELLGTTTAVAGVAGLGALATLALGHKYGSIKDWASFKRVAGVGAKVGGTVAGLSSVLAYIIGRRLAGRRTNKEHEEYLNKSVLPNYIIPGVALYNRGRRQAMMDTLM